MSVLVDTVIERSIVCIWRVEVKTETDSFSEMLLAAFCSIQCHKPQDHNINTATLCNASNVAAFLHVL
jgi:hypothetical protein